MDSNSLHKTLLNKAVQLLAQRNHSSVELQQKLSTFYLKNLANRDDSSLDDVASLIGPVLQYCISHHWLNDEDYIQQYINMRTRKGYGKNRIIRELKQRGLDHVLVLAVISKQKVDWYELAVVQVNKKFPLIDKHDIPQKAKIFQYLLYRGFNQEEINFAYSSLSQ